MIFISLLAKETVGGSSERFWREGWDSRQAQESLLRPWGSERRDCRSGRGKSRWCRPWIATGKEVGIELREFLRVDAEHHPERRDVADVCRDQPTQPLRLLGGDIALPERFRAGFMK